MGTRFHPKGILSSMSLEKTYTHSKVSTYQTTISMLSTRYDWNVEDALIEDEYVDEQDLTIIKECCR